MGTNHVDQFPFVVCDRSRQRRRITVILTGCITGLAIWFCNPWLSGFAFYGITFGLSFCSCPSAGLSGTECRSGSGVSSRKNLNRFQFNAGRSHSLPWSPVTRSLKERFRLSATTETPGTFGPFAQTPALLICGPEGPNETDCVSIK